MNRLVSRRKFLQTSLAASSLVLSGKLSAVAADIASSDALVSTSKLPNGFMWAVGIENTFIPRTQGKMRPLEEFTLMEHYRRWQGDLDLVASLGISKLRWGMPWYKVQPKPDKFDWAWADHVLEYMIDKLKIDPILDLVHYGTPAWIEAGILDKDYPEIVGKWSEAVAKRYRNVKFFTPMNEPTVAGEFCLKKGLWPPYKNDMGSYIAGMISIARGIQHSCRAIKSVAPQAKLVAVEAMHWYQPKDEHCQDAADLEFHKDLVAYSLSAGMVDRSHPLFPWLSFNGVDERTLHELRRNAVEHDIVGVNYYPWSASNVSAKSSGSSRPTITTGEVSGGESAGKSGLPIESELTPLSAPGKQLEQVLNKVAVLTKKPLFVTETSCAGTDTERGSWMDETIQAVDRANASGVNVVGYTWFPLFTMINWDYRTNSKSLKDNLLHLGLWKVADASPGRMSRVETSLVERYRHYVKTTNG